MDITNNPRYNIGYDARHGTITLLLHNVTPADEGLYLDTSGTLDPIVVRGHAAPGTAPGTIFDGSAAFAF